MQIEIINKEKKIAQIKTDELVIKDVQSALDIIATIRYEYGCDAMIISKASITEDFYNLSTCLVGEIAQKYVNYGMRMAIIGDFSQYKSKSLHDFIYECNHGKDLFFVQDEKKAVELLG